MGRENNKQNIKERRKCSATNEKKDGNVSMQHMWNFGEQFLGFSQT